MMSSAQSLRSGNSGSGSSGHAGDNGEIPSRIGDYLIGPVLGQGAMSVVYRARRGGETFALKLRSGELRSDALDVQLLFRREAAAIARLDHPSLVKVIEVGECEGRPYLVMDLIEGESLDKRLSKGVLGQEETLSLAKAIASALVEVHRFGLVHRDIKPGNIVISPSGAVKLIDFGLVSGTTESDAVVGTLHYAAPEQVGVLKRAVGAPADLYSLGATLFECLSGRPPIEAHAQSDFLSLLSSTPAPDLLSVCPHSSPALSAILARLLCKDPDDRYQNARGLLADLDALPALDAALSEGRPLVLGSQDAPLSNEQEVPLVGRKEELSRLTRSLDRASEGQTTFVQVEGEGGSGKTRLVREVMSIATTRGALVLAGKCQEIDTVPFGPLREAVSRYAAGVQRLPEAERKVAIDRIRAAAGGYAPLIRRLSAGLGSLLGDTTELRALEPDAEQQRYYEAIASFFRGLGSAASPCVLLVDDAQWLDEGSLRVLQRLAVAGATAHLLILTTARDHVASHKTQPLVQALRTQLDDRIALGPLSIKSIGQLVASRLGGKPLEAPLVEKLFALTQGNPFAAGEYLRALLDGGLVRPIGGRWAADATALDAVSLPKDVVALMVGRLSSLGHVAANLIGIAGVIGSRFSLPLLAQVSRRGGDVLSHFVEEVSRAGLVERGDGDIYVFIHDRIREAARAHLTEEQRRDAHQMIAERLDALRDPTPEQLHAIARHYAQGHVTRTAKRACETNLAAGLHALKEHANEEAFELLDRALGMANQADLFESLAMPLLEGLGRACAMTGRLSRAFDHLEDALRRARDQKDRFRIRYLLTLTYASQGRNDDAYASLLESFKTIGRPFPKSGVVQILVLIWSWILALGLRAVGIGYGSAKGEERERRRVLSQLHYTGSMIALFQGRPILTVQFIVRDFLNVHFLGATGEAAIAYSVYGAVLGTFQLRSVMQRYTRLGVSMAEQLGDNAALAVCRAYQAIGLKWSGDLIAGNKQLVEVALPELQRHVPGSWYQAMMLCEQAYSYLHGGLSLAAIDHIRANLSQLERTNNLMFRYNTRSVLYAQLMVSGQVNEAAELWTSLEEQYQPLSNTIYVGLARCIAQLEVMVDEEETGPRVDEQIAAFRNLLSEDYYSSAARVLAGYARLAQFLNAKGEDKKGARRRLLQETRSLSIRAMQPVFKCHALIFKAALYRVDGKLEKARTLLLRAERLANKCQSRRGTFHVALEMARLTQQTGEATSSFYAGQALKIAVSERWRLKSARVRVEFNLKEDRPAASTQMTMVPAGTMAASLEQTPRYAEALLQVSLASASTLDPEVLAKNALGEVSRILGAERALFYLMDEETGDMQLKAATGTGAERASQTVVRKVAATRAPVVLTGNDDGEALGSESIVTYGLRSIMAAPLLLRDRLVGVVYVDSRLAKGMFTNDDVAILLGVSNHIAIAIDTARTARLEAKSAALARDLEVVGAVQTLLLPKIQTFEMCGLRGAGFYQPAAQCGGDWWWYDTQPDGSVMIVLGDVSGHGAGPAMISSAVAGAFHTIRSLQPDADPADILKELGRCVQTFSGGFHMTMSVVRIDPKARALSIWNAAGPEMFLLRQGQVRCLTAPGSVLGDEGALQIGYVTSSFYQGDRLLLCTDGVLELERADGRPLGAKQVSKLFAQSSQPSLAITRARLGEAINGLLGGRPQADDITFVLVEGISQEGDEDSSTSSDFINEVTR